MIAAFDIASWVAVFRLASTQSPGNHDLSIMLQRGKLLVYVYLFASVDSNRFSPCMYMPNFASPISPSKRATLLLLLSKLQIEYVPRIHNTLGLSSPTLPVRIKKMNNLSSHRHSRPPSPSRPVWSSLENPPKGEGIPEETSQGRIQKESSCLLCCV